MELGSENKLINDRRQRGLTLVEMLVVMVIIAVVASVALFQFGTSREQFRRQNVALQLKTAFERARFDSVKRRADAGSIDRRARVTVAAGSFTLSTDENGNGTATDTTDSATTNFADQNIFITGSGMILPVTVFFNQRGEVTATDAGGSIVNPIFLVCNGTCSFDNDTTANANIVLVTPTGTVNMLPGGAAIPTFSPPPVTPVSPGSQINIDVTIPTSGT